MPWTLPSHEHKRFQRNPLAAVIVQLRFDPILKIATGVPDFQDKIRSRFSLYEERDVKVVEVEAPSVSAVRTRRVKEHRFRTRGEPTTVVLGDQGVSLEYLAHQHRDVLLPDVKLVTDSLSSTFQDVSPTRLGLRYVNVVDRDRVAADAGSPAEWSDLIEPSFLQMPAALADLAGTRFANEITSEMPVGAMTLRYGLLPASEDRLGFRLDIDRYHQESFDMADVEALVRAFADDIFQVFMAAAGPSLVDWMEEEA
ncbi:MAG: TIGR04255 family protein [Myxococcales bacterium]|nr:TIGR04255 family protein [Myxococcales bacterium]